MAYSLNPAIEIAEAEGGAIALDKKTGAYLQLNTMGLRVLRSMLADQSLDKMHDELAEEYPEQRHRIRDDLHALEEDLLARGVVRQVDT